MSIYGLFLLFIAYMFLKKSNRKNNLHIIGKYRIGTFTLICGIIIIISSIFKFYALSFSIIFFHMGISFIIAEIDNIYKKRACTKEVKAKYIEFSTRQYRDYYKRHIPKFSYTIDNKVYIEESFQNLPKKYLTKNFIKGNKYSIYVNPESCTQFIVKKSITLEQICSLILGICIASCGLIFIY